MSATTSSTPAYLPEIIALIDVVKAMLFQNKTPSPAHVKAIEETCVTCGGPHPYYKCLATEGNTFNASAATGTYNQGGQGYHPQRETNNRASNQMRPLGFPQPNVQNNQNQYNQNQYNQNRGNNFNQGNQNYQAPFNQTQVGPSNDFSNYMKTNDVNMRTMQNQISNMKTGLKNEFQTTMKNQNNELKNMMSNELKNMMSSFIQIGVSYNGPTIPPTSSPLPKEVEREPEATKDKTNLKPSIPYPSRLNDQKLREKANNQMLKSLQIFQRLHFELSFADALLHTPKFASTFKSLLSNKEKLFELANTLLNENCSAVLLKKLPKKLGDPSKFLIPYEAFAPGTYSDSHDSRDRKLIGCLSGWPFLRTERALIDVHGEELILRYGDEKLIFHVDNSLKHPHTHGNEEINMINFIDITCEDRFPEVLKLKKSNHPSSGSTTPHSDYSLSDYDAFYFDDDHIEEKNNGSTTTHSDFSLPEYDSFIFDLLIDPFPPANRSDFYHEEFADVLALLDPFPLRNKDDNFDPEADLRKIEYLLNRDPSTES
ncbi:hypothetical protein Tco_0921744 [Tanacetum coccineum]